MGWPRYCKCTYRKQVGPEISERLDHFVAEGDIPEFDEFVPLLVDLLVYDDLRQLDRSVLESE